MAFEELLLKKTIFRFLLGGVFFKFQPVPYSIFKEIIKKDVFWALWILFKAFNMENYCKTEPTEANLYYVIFEKIAQLG